MTENPCRRCASHGEGCHAHCVLYKAWKKNKAEEDERIMKARRLENDAQCVQFKGRQTNGRRY